MAASTRSAGSCCRPTGWPSPAQHPLPRMKSVSFWKGRCVRPTSHGLFVNLVERYSHTLHSTRRRLRSASG
eukprot:4975677-Heterocapsa_arctica.AAC.1